MDGPILNFHLVTKKYGNQETLRGVSFELQRGQVLGLAGENGAGKTTLIESILKAPILNKKVAVI